MSSISSALLCTIVFIFFLLPGFIFLQGFFYSKRGTLNPSNFYTYLFWGTFTSLIIYSLSYMTCTTFNLYKISFDEICPLFLQKIELTDRDNQRIYILKIKGLINFFLITNIFSLLYVLFFKGFIVFFKLDTLSPVFRFSNPWVYVLTGRRSEKYTILYKDFIMETHLMCDINKSIVLYKGMVSDYKLKDDTLDYLCLTKLERTGITEWEDAAKEGSVKNFTPTFMGDVIRTPDTQHFSGTIFEKNNLSTTTPEDKLEKLKKINLNPVFYNFPGSVLFKTHDIKNFYYQYQELDLSQSEEEKQEKERRLSQINNNRIN